MAPGPSAEAQAQAAKLAEELKQLKADVAAPELLAPAAGQVVEVSARPGQPVAQGAVVAKLADTSSLTAVIRLNSADARALKAGASAMLRLGAVNQKVTLDKVDGERAEATLDNKKGALKPGAEGEAELPGESKSIFGRM